MVDSLLAIHQQRENTARIAECLAGLLCSWIALTISAGWDGNPTTSSWGGYWQTVKYDEAYRKAYGRRRGPQRTGSLLQVLQ